MEDNLGLFIIETVIWGIGGVIFFRFGVHLRKHPQSLELGASSRIHKTNEKREKWLKSVKDQAILFILVSFIFFFVCIAGFISFVVNLLALWDLM